MCVSPLLLSLFSYHHHCKEHEYYNASPFSHSHTIIKTQETLTQPPTHQWGIQTHPRLYAPSGNHVHAGEAVEEASSIDPTDAQFRVELQTLTRLPETQALLFSFKTYLYPLADIRAEGLGPQLAEAVEGLKEGNAPGMWVYKGGVSWGRAVCELLRGGEV